MSITYDGSLVTQMAQTGEVTGNVGFDYDNDFRVKEQTVNNLNPVLFGYDDDSLLTQAGNLTLAYSNQNALLEGATLGNVTDSLGYNDFGELETYTANYNNSAIYSTTYIRDKLGPNHPKR